MENKANHRGIGAPPSNAITTTTATTTSTAPPPEAPGSRRRASGVKRKGNASTSSAPKRTRGKSFTPLPHIHHNHNGPITRARQSPNKAAAAAAAAGGAAASSSSTALNAAGGVHDKPIEPTLLRQPTPPAIGEVTTASQDVIAANEDRIAPLEPEIDAEFEAIRSRDPNVHVIPTPSAWFSWTKVHPIEERALPSFFNGKLENRTSDIYMEIRNTIMKKFRRDPKTQIEAKDLPELTIGELDARKEVMEFLDHWGLINFHPFPVVDSDKAENTKTASLIDKLYRFEVALSRPRESPKVDMSTQTAPPRLLPESAIADEVRPEGPDVEYHCNSCSADCSRKRYHCQKQADFDLCSECYNNGKFDSGMSPADFILMEPAEVPVVSGGSWTDQETLLLLEALELFGENWTEIAEHVATKSKAQCILHFVQMPIEDTFLEGKDDFDASFQGNNGPGSTYDDSSALKESNETVESNSASNIDSALKESHETKESNTPNNGSSTLNKSAETAESKGAEERLLSPKVDASDPRDAVEVKAAQEISANFAITALKEAFLAVGSGDSFSFADAGNPVMALAAFLSSLVPPDIAAASARSSLKATSEKAPGLQLASRHCFILEDPPEDLEKPHASESADIEMLDVETQKEDDKAQKDENHKEEHFQVQNSASVEAQKGKDQNEDEFQVQNHMAVLDGSDVSKDSTDKVVEDTVPEEPVTLVSLPDEGKENCATKEPDDATNKEDVVPGSINEINDSALPRQDQLSSQDAGKEICAAKEPDDVTNKEDVTPSPMKESNDSATAGKDLLSSVNGTNDLAIPSEVALTSVTESAAVVPPEEISQFSEVSKDVDMVSGSVPSKDKDPQETVSPSTMEVSKDVDMVPVSVPSKDKDPQETVAPSTMEVSKDVDMVSGSVLSKDNDPQETVAPSTMEVSKDVDMVSGSVPSKDKDPQETVAPSTMEESDDSTLPGKDLLSTVNGSDDLAIPSVVAPSVTESISVVPPGEISLFSEVPKDVDMASGSVPSKDEDPEETVVPTSATETGATAGECALKVTECKSEKACNLLETRDDHNVEKVKRAALGALSAAAVKSKLLADQEENQIRQLSTFLIEKQLHKIETKLGFFTDMENVILRAKDQMDRSRQRLYHERAQIIAARLGMPASSSRAMPPSLPSNRAALSYANSVPKSLPNMNSQKAPVKTVTNASAPSPPFSSVSSASPGGSTHTSR